MSEKEAARIAWWFVDVLRKLELGDIGNYYLQLFQKSYYGYNDEG